MNSGALTIRLWGVRGSIPVSGEAFRIFGGNTIAFEVRCGERILLFDAGSGLPRAGRVLKAEGMERADLFFTHCHYDHIIGLPFFKPLYDPGAALTVWSGHLAGVMTTRDMVKSFMNAPWFPVGPGVCRAHLSYRDFVPGAVLDLGDGIIVRTHLLNHPGGAVGYRVEWAGRTVAIVTDTEHQDGSRDPAVMKLIEGADCFLYDAAYTDAEMDIFRGFGHSTWQEAIRLAKAAGARRVGLIHHADWREDAALAAIEAEAQAAFPEAFCGRDGQVIEL